MVLRVDDLRAVGLFEAADELALRPAGVVGSRAGDTAFVVVSGRQGSVDTLLAGGGVATRPAAEKLVDDYVAAIRGGLDDPGEFDRLRGLFEADLRVAKAYARWGDDIFDAGGNVIDDLVEAVCSANSFAGDTLVAMADGTMAPIADVQVGDQVSAYDFDTGETVAREVTATLPHTDWLLEAHLSDGSVMSVTEDHRFWSITDTAWVELQDLDTTDMLLTPNGATVTVDWLDWIAGETAPAWDLTVAEEHNFFVAADATAEPLLVHNQTLGTFCDLPIGVELALKLAPVNDALVASGDSGAVNLALKALGRQERIKALDAIANGVTVGASPASRADIARRASTNPTITQSFASSVDSNTLARVLSARNYDSLAAAAPDELFEIARSGRARLAIDADNGNLKVGELRTALAAEADFGIVLSRNTESGADWLIGTKTYDALGPFPRFNEQWSTTTTLRFDEHLRDYDFVIVDVAGLNSSQLETVLEFIDSKSTAEQAKVLLVESVTG